MKNHLGIAKSLSAAQALARLHSRCVLQAHTPCEGGLGAYAIAPNGVWGQRPHEKRKLEVVSNASRSHARGAGARGPTKLMNNAKLILSWVATPYSARAGKPHPCGKITLR